MRNLEKNKFDLSSHFSIITGAGGLLGKEHAKALLNLDCSVVLTDINESNLKSTYDELKEEYKPEKIKILLMDVTNIDSVNLVYQNLKDSNLFIDILINNAAIDPKVNKDMDIANPSKLENFDLFQWNKEIEVGLTGALNCIKVFGYQMAESNKNCVILNIASDLSVIAPDQRIYRKENIDEEMQQVKPVTYSVIKSGLVGLTKYVATYWADKGVRCNALSPGGILIINQRYLSQN